MTKNKEEVFDSLSPSDKTPSVMIEDTAFVIKSIEDKSYKKALNEIRSNLSPGLQVVSRVYHLNIIEKTLNFLAKFLFRPKMILYGVAFSLISQLFLYTIAKKNGYILSGSEAILSYIIGSIFGGLLDIKKHYFKNK